MGARRRHLLVGLLALACVVLPGLAFADTFPAGATRLDSYSPANSGSVGPVTVGSGPLTAGVTYRVVVRGTFSAWTKWPARQCGRSLSAPFYSSPGVADEPVGVDAEFRFAEPRFQKKCKPSGLPRRTFVLQFDVGDGFKHYDSTTASRKRPNRSHRYAYLVTGTGAPLQARLLDWKTDDNDGALALTVAPA